MANRYLWTERHIIPAGTVFLLSCGEYSSYGVYAIMRALKDIDPSTKTDNWALDLVSGGLAEELPLWEVHDDDKPGPVRVCEADVA